MDWIQNGNSSYRFFPNSLMEWTDAVDFCKTVGGEVVSLETEEEYNYIKTLILSNHGKC